MQVFLRIRSKTLFFPITQNTHDFVSTSVRHIYNTDDVVMSSYRRWNNVLSLLGNSRIKDGIFPISLLRQTEQKYRDLSVFDTQWQWIKTISFYNNRKQNNNPAEKMSIFGVFLVCIFLHSHWIFTFTE